MRSVVLATILLLGATGIAVGQALPSGSSSLSGGDAALTYQWVRTNTLGSCGCFSLNGVGLAASWAFRPPFAAVAEASVEHTASGPSGSSLTLTTYMAGVRYAVDLQPSREGTRGLQGFAQLLAGGGHAGGGVAGPGDATNSFVSRIGGGLDWPINPRFTARIIQADYYLTAFNNGANNHQNNILIGAGIVYMWSHGK